MRTLLSRMHDDERGMSFAFVGLGFLAFFAATTLAIDVGMFMTARSQAQTSADAGALGGAVALVFDSFDDRSAGGPVVQAAMNTASANKGVGGPVSVDPSDVTFPVGPAGANRVRVNVYRTLERKNAVPTLIGPVFGVDTVDIAATATAEAAPANAIKCVRPFTIPDRWIENQDPAWSFSSTFDRYDNKGRVIPNADVYVPPGGDGYKGYDPYKDKGMLLTLRAGGGNNIEPTMYYSWKMPGAIGGSYYDQNISGCNPTEVSFKYIMTQEPGNMVGPTNDGIDALIAQDPTAFWDSSTNSVHSDKDPTPRVFPIPLYDPDFYQSGITNGRNATLRVANWIGFFVEGRSGNEVYGRITPILGIVDPDLGPAPDGVFPRAIRLVQ